MTTKTSEKNDENTSKKGVEGFLKRQYQARQTRMEKEQLLAQGNTQNTTNNKPSAKKTRATKPKEFNFASNKQLNSEKKDQKNDQKETKDDVYISDTTYGDALNYLHAELHKIDL